MESAEVKRGMESVGLRGTWNHRWREAWNQLGGERPGIGWVKRGMELVG